MNARANGTEINKKRRRISIKHFIVETERKKRLIEQLQSDEMPLHMPKFKKSNFCASYRRREREKLSFNQLTLILLLAIRGMLIMI